MEPLEQASSTAPTRRRRRRLIAAFGLLLVSGAAWWHWPQADARLVGRWSVAFNGDTAGPHATYVFHSNGVLDQFVYGEKPLRVAWSTSGDELFISERVPAPVLCVIVRLFSPRSAAVEHLFLKQVDANHFTMGHARQYDYDIVLKRIAE